MFREVNDVKKALIRQIVASIDSNYLNKLRDETTNTIIKSIPEILQYLFDNFADITPQDVSKAEDKLNKLHWNINDPPIFLYSNQRFTEVGYGGKHSTDFGTTYLYWNYNCAEDGRF